METNNSNIKPWAQSRLSPDQYSKTIEGILLSVSSLVIWVLSHYGFSITTDQYITVVSNVVQTVAAGVTAFGGIQTLFGLFRKLTVKKPEPAI